LIKNGGNLFIPNILLKMNFIEILIKILIKILSEKNEEFVKIDPSKEKYEVRYIQKNCKVC